MFLRDQLWDQFCLICLSMIYMQELNALLVNLQLYEKESGAAG